MSSFFDLKRTVKKHVHFIANRYIRFHLPASSLPNISSSVRVLIEAFRCCFALVLFQR